jgi:glycosyltransferase involved in cell wall biosynthesis
MIELFPNRPLVTFALFAYNQEQYIREAIMGAFSQTYEPLEIILSDDCSTDRTFEIMLEMVSEYRGPHQVRVVRTDRNLGVTSHMLLRGREAAGRIVVGAAGDDISTPERCAEHVRCYRDPNVMAVSGSYDLIDECGNVISQNVIGPISKQSLKNQSSLFINSECRYVVIQGSTASYRKDLFDLPLPNWDFIISEDNLLNYQIYSRGFCVCFLKMPLIQYRRHAGAVSNRERQLNKDSALEDHTEFRQLIESEKQLIRLLKWIDENQGHTSKICAAMVERRYQDALDRDQWNEYGILRRFTSLSRSLLLLNTPMVRWKALRLFGKFPKFQPRYSIIRHLGR